MQQQTMPQHSLAFEDELPLGPWQEVPQALFLSWPPARQMAYCAARDEASILFCDTTPEEARWYQDRADFYRSTCTLNEEESHAI
jgi:hypothetical protein